ncbi:MAG: serine/threonine-protein kinase, partial [Myxococcaceae bacterium]
MGKVFRAVQVSLDKAVVLKVLRHDLLSDERTVARFQREAKLASRLNHPNTISVLDFGQLEDGALYIAMELVSGQDLHQILSSEWPLPESRVIKLVGQVLAALADAHGAGVIHRDLKPENIMVEQRRGDPDFVKVLDFGIAKIQDAAAEEGPALTRAGFVCGTPEYMSPEQARGAQLDNRSDLYAVGVILYQLMTGLLPFESDSAVGFATKHLAEPPPPPSQRRPEANISPAMEALILKAMSKNPADRPPDASAFRAELLAVENAPRKATPKPARKQAPQASDEIATRIIHSPPSWKAAEDVTATEAPVTSRGGGGMLALKIATVALVLIAGGLVAMNALGKKESELPPPPVATATPEPATPTAPVEEKKAWEKEVPADERDVAGAIRLEREGDDAQQRGEVDEAVKKYRGAFEKNPDPLVAFKLGE